MKTFTSNYSERFAKAFTSMRFPLCALVLLICFLDASGEEPSLKSAKAAYQKADASLNAIYQKAKANLSEYEFSKLQKEQRDWLEYRDHRSNSSAVYDGGVPEGKEQTSVEYWETAAAITKTRSTIINGLINWDVISEKEWEGSWEDGQGRNSLYLRKQGRHHPVFGSLCPWTHLS